MTNTINFTRQQYLNHECTHEDYYNQFVNEVIKNRVLSVFPKDKLKEAFEKDENLNTLPLKKWDSITMYDVTNKMKEAGDSLTLAGSVCIAKAAARQIINE